MQTSRKLNILLSGPGLIGRKHTQLLMKSNRSELAAIVAPPAPHNTSFAEKCNVQLFESVEAALDATKIDAAIIASPNEFHCEQALTCIERGIPILVEKPLAADLASATRIYERSRANGTPVLVGHHRTYSPLLPAARKFISSARFGRLVAVQGSALFRKPEHYFIEGPWRTRIGGGPILINLIHEVGIMQYLCGPIRSVSAQASNKQRNFEIEDTVIISLIFENNAMGSFILSDIAASNKSWEMTSGENPAYPYFSDADCYHFAGTNGSLDFPSFKLRFYRDDCVPSWWNSFETEILSVSPTDPLERQIEHFEDVVSGRAEPIVSVELGLANLRVLEAIRISIERASSVDVAKVGA